MLEIGHGVDPGIREHIQKDIPVMKLEGIEARLLHLLQALGRGQQLQLLDDLYLVHFHGDGFVFVNVIAGIVGPLLLSCSKNV